MTDDLSFGPQESLPRILIVARLAADPELCHRMGAAGRAMTVTQYDWEKNVDRMLEIYRSVL